MVTGVKRIETRLTQGDENGIYRITDQKGRYLLLTFDGVDEAREVGKAIAKLLKVSFKDHIYTDPKLGGVVTGRMDGVQPNISNDPKPLLFTRPKRVMGAEKECIALLLQVENRKTEQEIKAIFVDKYCKAGHRGNKPKQLADWLLKVAKKKIHDSE